MNAGMECNCVKPNPNVNEITPKQRVIATYGAERTASSLSNAYIVTTHYCRRFVNAVPFPDVLIHVYTLSLGSNSSTYIRTSDCLMYFEVVQ